MQELTITETARNRLIDLLNRNKSDRLFLGVANKGCGGNKFSLNFSGTGSIDHVLLDNGILIIEPSAQRWMKDLTIDYLGDGLTPGFQFQHAEHRLCGCGESFTIKSTRAARDAR
jgi:iron-sulfur cluster assembly accessory protein